MGTRPVPFGAGAGPAKSEKRQSAPVVLAVRLLAIGLLSILALGPGSADAVTLVPFEGARRQPYQAWANRAKVPTVSGAIQFYLRSDPSCPGRFDSCTGVSPLHIFLGDHDRWTLYHELGHVFDQVVMGADGDPSAITGWRQRFLAIRGDSRPWREGVNPPHEQFAQAYMFCAMCRYKLPRGPRTGYVWQYGYAKTTKRQHRRSCRLIYNAWQVEGG
jgi:hypothetical protein